jgi:hypothetical protein
MVLRGSTSLRGALEGVGPEMARAKRVPFGPKKVRLAGTRQTIEAWFGLEKKKENSQIFTMTTFAYRSSS